MRTATVGSSPSATTYLRYFPTGGASRRVLIVGGAILLCMAILLLQTSIVASTGYEVEQLTKTREYNEHQNQDMEAEVASLRSLDRIEREARGRLKMITPTSYVFVTVDAIPTQPTPLLSKSLNALRQQETPQRQWWERIPLVRQLFRSDS